MTGTSALDAPHIPGERGHAAALYGKATARASGALEKLVRRYHASVDEALRYSDVRNTPATCCPPQDGERDAS